MARLESKVAVVTGAANGIGRALPSVLRPKAPSSCSATSKARHSPA
jgi:NADP-dependent 3-hydroxy acid dehydrogenase YdfG